MIEIHTNLTEEQTNELIQSSNKLKALDFLIWLRDDVLYLTSKEGEQKGEPSNGELRRWLEKGSVYCNDKILTKGDTVAFPITSLALFPKNDKARCSVV